MEYQQGFGIPPELYYQQQQAHQSMVYPFQQEPNLYFNSPYYQHYQQMMQQTSAGYSSMPSTNTLDYQMTPALYVLNQQAKILEKSLLPGMIDQPVSKPDKRRKQRGPYRKKNPNASKSPSPTPSVQSSDGSSSAEDRCGSAQEGTLKRRISSELIDEDSQDNKQFKGVETPSIQMLPTAKTSIFRSIDLMAQSSACGQF